MSVRCYTRNRRFGRAGRLAADGAWYHKGMSTVTVPAHVDDRVNAAILRVSEDRIRGFLPDPLGEIASQSGVPVETVIERIQAMLRAGTIRRVRQTLMATNLAQGALVAWQVPPERLDAAFDYLFQQILFPAMSLSAPPIPQLLDRTIVCGRR